MTARSSVEDVRAPLAERGFVVLPTGAFDASLLSEPFSFVEALVGERPLMVERQTIRSVPGGRSFASTNVVTPMHTDSQPYLGNAPALQVMWCRRPAPSGGECQLVDGARLLAIVEREDSELYRALFDVPRRIPFYFGDFVGPTARRHATGAPILTVSPMPLDASDSIGARWAAFVAKAPRIEFLLAAGELLLVDNFRMLHGRRAFSGDDRELVRLLSWQRTPLSLQRPLAPAEPGTVDRKLAAILDLALGLSPAKVAAREGVREQELYAWRDEALTAARAALTR